MWGLLTQGLAAAQGILTPLHSSSSHQEGSTELYTGPYASGGAWASAYDRAVELVSQMTVEEKVGQRFSDVADAR